jgi:hypothetical protein
VNIIITVCFSSNIGNAILRRGIAEFLLRCHEPLRDRKRYYHSIISFTYSAIQSFVFMNLAIPFLPTPFVPLPKRGKETFKNLISEQGITIYDF